MGDILLGFGWGQQMDPEQHMYRQFLSTNQPPNGYNFVHYANPQVDKLLMAANSTLATSQRKSALSQVEKILAVDLPYVYLFNVPEYWAVSEQVARVMAPAPMDRRYLEFAMRGQKK